MTEDGTTGGKPAAMTGGSSGRPATTPAAGQSADALPVGSTQPRDTLRVALTAQDVRRLTLFKWRYSLESAGFSSRQAAHLLFLKWLYTRQYRAAG